MRPRLWRRDNNDRDESRTLRERLERAERMIDQHRLFWRILIAIAATLVMGVVAGLAEKLVAIF